MKLPSLNTLRTLAIIPVIAMLGLFVAFLAMERGGLAQQSSVSNVRMGQSNVFLPGLISHSVILYPSNIVATGPTMASATANTRTITTTNNGFAAASQGWDIVLATNTVSGATNEQYRIVDKVNNNTVKVQQSVIRTYSGVGFSLYPPALDIPDIVGNHGAHFANDGSLILNSTDTTGANNAQVVWASTANTWWAEAKPDGGYAGSWTLNSTGPSGFSSAPPMIVVDPANSTNPYEALRIFPDGRVAIRIALTNNDGDLPITSKATFSKAVAFNGATTIASNLTVATTGAIYGEGVVVKSNSLAPLVTLNNGDVQFWSSNGVLHAICNKAGVISTNKLAP